MDDSKKQQFGFVCEDSKTSTNILSCVFFDNVPCSFRGSGKTVVTSRCSKCAHYKKFVEEMEREEEEFWKKVDEINKSLRCHCDGELCSSKPAGACFGVTADGYELAVCPRFDVNRFPDGSMIKEEFLRLRGGSRAGR